MKVVEAMVGIVHGELLTVDVDDGYQPNVVEDAQDVCVTREVRLAVETADAVHGRRDVRGPAHESTNPCWAAMFLIQTSQKRASSTCPRGCGLASWPVLSRSA